MKGFKKILMLFFAALFLMVASAAFAQQINCETPEGVNKYYVSGSNGSDSNPGTEAAPFKTIAKGISKLTAGDALYIRGGTYTGGSAFNNIPSGTSWTQPVIIRSYPGETVTLTPEPRASSILLLTKPQYTIFDGFIFDGLQKAPANIHAYSKHARIINSEIKNAAHQGILVGGEGSHNQFINLDVHDNGYIPIDATHPPDFNHGMYMTTDYNLVMNSELHNNAGWGITVSSTRNAPSYNIIINNKTYDNAGWGGRGPGIGIHNKGIGNVVAHNESWGNMDGIDVGLGPIDTILCNNKSYNNDRYGLKIGSSSGTKVGPNTNTGNGTDYINQGTNTDENFTGCADVLAKLPAASGSCGSASGPGTQPGGSSGLELKDINCIPPGNPVDLKITLAPGTTGSVYIGGMMPGFTLSAGSPVPNTGGVIWEVPVSAIPGLTMTPPSGFKGSLGIGVTTIPPGLTGP